MTASGSERVPAAHRRLTTLVVAVAVAAIGCVAPPPNDTAVPSLVQGSRPLVDPRAYTVRIRATGCEGIGVGSGFLLDAHTIITNRHVVEGADTLAVETYLGEDLTVNVASQGILADLAVVKVDKGIGTTARLAGTDPPEGTRIRAFGYPGGGPMTVTSGHVDSYVSDARLGNIGRVMRSDVDVRPGNSGGPALDDDGRVVGVVYAIDLRSDLSLIVPVSTLSDLLSDTKKLNPVEGC